MVEWELRRENKVLGENLRQYHFVHDSSNMICTNDAIRNWAAYGVEWYDSE
jgi:hypothetical protein